MNYLPMNEYIRLAKVFMSYFGYKQWLLSEEKVGIIAHEVMKADWLYKEEKSKLDTYRMKRALWALQRIYDKEKNKKIFSESDLQPYYKPASYENDENKLRYIDEETPEKSLIEKEKEQLIEFLVKNANLTDIQRQCLNMHFYDGKNATQISKELKKSPQAVQQTIQGALSNLRLTIGEEYGDYI